MAQMAQILNAYASGPPIIKNKGFICGNLRHLWKGVGIIAASLSRLKRWGLIRR